MIKIDNDKVSNKGWADVDKTNLGNRISNAYEAGECTKAVINECYAYVPDEAFEKDKFLHSKAKLPHHELIGNTLVLNRGGVIASGGAIAGARTKLDVPAAEKGKIKAHIRRHYGDLEMPAPDALK